MWFSTKSMKSVPFPVTLPLFSPSYPSPQTTRRSQNRWRFTIRRRLQSQTNINKHTHTHKHRLYRRMRHDIISPLGAEPHMTWRASNMCPTYFRVYAATQFKVNIGWNCCVGVTTTADGSDRVFDYDHGALSSLFELHNTYTWWWRMNSKADTTTPRHEGHV